MCRGTCETKPLVIGTICVEDFGRQPKKPGDSKTMMLRRQSYLAPFSLALIVGAIACGGSEPAPVPPPPPPPPPTVEAPPAPPPTAETPPPAPEKPALPDVAFGPTTASDTPK